jgi:hypothetical protein
MTPPYHLSALVETKMWFILVVAYLRRVGYARSRSAETRPDKILRRSVEGLMKRREFLPLRYRICELPPVSADTEQGNSILVQQVRACAQI